MSLRVTRRGDDGFPDGLATMSRASMDEWNLASGDHVSVRDSTGERGVVQVLPDSNVDEGLHVDGRLERLLGVDPGDRVWLDPVDVTAADRVSLVLTERLETVDNLSLYFRERLIGQALVEGQRLRVERDPDETADATTRDVVVEVGDTAPDSRVVVRDWTSIRVRTGLEEISVADGRSGRRSMRVTSDDVGGLDAELAALDELVDLAVQHPDRCERFGIDPPKGVLLHGPSGTGKTLLARAAAAHADAHVEELSGPALAALPPAEVETRLDAAFDSASDAAPAVVLLEDVDALCATNGRTDGTLPSVLARLDALGRRSRTIVVATTTSAEAVEAALRRPGRLADEISVEAPDRAAREEILEIHVRSLPLADDVDLATYAERTHGFVGNDLASLVRESLLRALRRRDGQTSLDETEVDRATDGDATNDADGALTLDEAPPDLRVTTADLDAALRTTEPSALRELLVEVPEVSWADVGGLEDVKARLRESVEWPLTYADAFERVALRPPTGVLLYGPPGTGKTLLAKAVANEADSNFVSIKGPELLDKYVGESEKGIRDVFAKARENAPTVVFFDEIDAIAGHRGDGAGDSGVTERIVSQLLTELDGLEDLQDVVVVATTNRPNRIDEALLRPGRFDRHVHVGAPDEAARREIFAVHTRERPLADDVDLDALAAATDGYVGADVEAVCREAATAAVRDHVHENGSDVDTMTLTREHFEDALDEVTPSAAGDDRFSRFRERVDGE